MKNYYFILIILFSSCKQDYLDVIPDNIPTIDIAFNNRATALNFLATCYTYIPEHANVVQNFSMLAGDEVWYYAENDFYMNNETSFRLAKGMQNVSNPYLNYWEGGRGAPHSLFNALRDCNIFLDNLVTVPGLEEQERLRWLDEVKVLKAFYHFWLMQMYGPIPIVENNISVGASAEETNVFRDPVDDVVNYLVQLLDEVIEGENLPGVINFIYTEQGRVTMPVAKALKAKILVLNASPIFNGNTDFNSLVDSQGNSLVNQTYDPQKWVLAKDALYEAIESAESNGHQLYEFTQQIPINGELSEQVIEELSQRAAITESYNSEIIWAYGPEWTGDLQMWCQPRWTADHSALFGYTKKSHAPTLNMVETFYSNNGVPLNEDIYWNYADRYDVVSTPLLDDNNENYHEFYIEDNYSTAKLHTYREPRFYSSIGFDGGKWFSLETTNINNIPYLDAKAGALSGKQGFEIYSITGYFAKKLVHYENVIAQEGSTIKGYSFPIIRLSDLYLMYAEALNEVKESPDSEVYEYIQKVRDKAGLDDGGDLVNTWQLYSSNPSKPSSKEGMRDIIHQERMIELALEGHRYWDLRRWKLADEYFSQPIRGWNIFRPDVEGFYEVENIYYRNYLIKDYLWPISQNELLRNPNLVQNPGW
ncbi:RagB/SusD family nutrient uptake outer membrane protein [Flavobacteriaceae bacterium]|jgi:starch-binding outer membrane protein, SusD/RagB family|nr:RagB/SusD family nutrient uptake outer membrane protein [bacterium]MDA9067754.1 RagB/SusD family nutrient uptake outer membrane protein [Flavobacteriaceae bacterium]MDB4212927.1 RagB/SusD family nutrient uptake outer membrane protein [Flavobacteriaceae bacterium]MDC1321220.1 RagB/SusD family nutrient uptake outer membrane protein [Flavobacteriaceae bacterium]